MSKKIPITIMLTLLVASIALFAATAVMAQERPFECWANGDTYKLSLAEGYPESVYTNRWRWRYNISCVSSGACAKINKIVGYLPSLPPNVLNLFSSQSYPEPVVQKRGAGDTSTNMGAAITNGIAFTITPVEGGNNPTATIEFLTDVGSTGLMSVGFNTGKGKLEGCFALDSNDIQGPVGGIIGPGFDQVAIIRPGTAFEECKPLEENLSIMVEKNPVTLCAEKVTAFPSVNCTGNGVEVDPEEPDPNDPGALPVAGFSGAANQFCEEAFLKFVESPACFQYLSGGRTRYLPPGCR